MSRLFLAIIVVVVLATPCYADERGDALALVNRGITAHGGAEALGRAARLNRVARGVMTLAGNEAPFSDQMLLHLPQRMRLEVDAGRTRMVLVVDGDKGWQSTGGAAVPLSAERVVELREELYALWLATLVPLAAEKGLALAPLPETKVNGRPAAGVKVSRKGASDVRLYFDRDTGLLVKMERSAREGGLTLDKEYLFSEHQPFDGVRLPTKQVELLGGKKFAEITSAVYRRLGRVGDDEFGKP
jgi:hypothetical protein